MAKNVRGQRFAYKKGLGQHFLYDEALLEQLADLAGVTGADGVLEIGPGIGSLTVPLARRARAVAALELDGELLPALREKLTAHANVQVHQGDAMSYDLAGLVVALGSPCRLVANLPYYITTPLLMRVLTERLPLCGMAVMIQAEVGEKLLARPGTGAYGPLAIWAQALTVPKEALRVPASAFEPPPKVDSSFMLLHPRPQPLFPPEHGRAFDRMVRAAFAMRRKTLANNLQSAYGLSKGAAADVLRANGLPSDVRGEALSPQMLYQLALDEAFA